MFNKKLDVQSRQHSIRFGDGLTGGPSSTFSNATTRLGNFNKRAVKNITATLDRLEKRSGKSVVNVQWLDGIEIRKGEAYYVCRAVFQLQPRLTLVINGERI